jgi:MATE family multidrug resistance protein
VDPLKKHYITNLKIAVPVMIGQLGHITVSVADSVMVGTLGTIPLASAALANSLFAVFMVFGIGVIFAITPLVANADGKRGKHLQGIILHHGFWISAVLGVILFLLISALGPFLHLMKQDPGVVPLTLPYLNIISASVIPLLIFLSFKQFAEGLSDTRVAMLISVGCNLLNIGFNYLLIFGNFGFPELGLNGAGWATLLARILMMAAMWWYVMRNQRFAKYNISLFTRRVRQTVARRIIDVGVPSGLQYIFEVAAFSIAAVLAGMISASALAAHHIAINIASVSYMAATGLGAAASVRIGNQMGRRDPANLKRAARTLFAMTAGWMAFAGLIILLFRGQLAGFYSEDALVIDLAVKMLFVVVLFQLSDGLQAVGLGALRGFQDVRIPTLITFIAYWVITLPAAWFLSQKTDAGVMGIWYALAGGLTISAVLLLYRFMRLTKKFDQRWSSGSPEAS